MALLQERMKYFLKSMSQITPLLGVSHRNSFASLVRPLSLLYRQPLQAGRKYANILSFKVIRQLQPIMRRHCSSEKVERPPEMNKRPKEETNKKVGPISWFNLGVSGVVVGVMLAFYYYARNLKEEALA